MKTLGLIGGISWHSTAVYYTTINQLVAKKLGGAYSSRLLLYSVNYNDFKRLQLNNDWRGIEMMLTELALKLQNAGADCLVICSNTPHLVADKLIEKIKIPLIHIAEETAKEIASGAIKKVGLLGTKFTMENSFFTDRLTTAGIECITPGSADRDLIHKSIVTELSKGIFKKETKAKYLEIITNLGKQGVQGVILGCTEIGMLLNQTDCEILLFDTALIHSKAAAEFALTM